ncbi:hypothetical protein ACET3Z_000681 [Daucus carota]
MGTKQERANFYELLSLNSKENVGFEEIKKAYRSKALEYHPDVCPPSNREESTRKFVEIRKAYYTLSDPASRQMYDYEMSLVDSFGGSYLYEVKNVTYLYKSKAIRSSRFRVNKVSCRVKEMGTKQERANFYELLSLNSKENVGFEEIKKAYRSKALEYHPDVCPPSNREESTRKFVEIRKAYDTLSDPTSRQMYDYEMSLVDSFGEFDKNNATKIVQQNLVCTRFRKEFGIVMLDYSCIDEISGNILSVSVHSRKIFALLLEMQVDQAIEMYEKIMKEKFMFVRHRNALRFSPKYQASMANKNKSAKEKKVSSQSVNPQMPMSLDSDEMIERPIGRKAAKKLKRAANEAKAEEGLEILKTM